MTKRCARNDCHRPMDTTIPQHEFLGLCTFHHTQFKNGTIGRNFNPQNRETPVEEAAALIEQFNNEYHGGEGTYRALAKDLGISKDNVHIILNRRYPHVRSKVWMNMQSALADKLHHDQEGAAA